MRRMQIESASAACLKSAGTWQPEKMAFHQALARRGCAGSPCLDSPSSRRAPRPFTSSMQSLRPQHTQQLSHNTSVPALAANVRLTYSSSRGAPLQRHNAAGRLAAAAVDAALSHAQEIADGSVSVILLAGGVGKRMGAAIPKQYLPLRGQPIATYSLVTFAHMREVGEVVIVCDPSWQHIFETVLPSLPSSVAIKWALPGKERQDSVSNGLDAASADAAVVAVHDSARPLVTAADAARCMSDGSLIGAAVLGVPVKPTIKEVDSSMAVIKTLERAKLWEVQTPQCIRPGLLREGFALVRSQGLEVTDDVSIIEAMGRPVRITPGSYTNIKVTTPDDMSIAEKFMDELKIVEAAATAAATATAAPASAATAA